MKRMSDGENQANAMRLEQMESCAPELLADLKRAVEYFEANGGEREYSFLKAMKRTIAKAEGASEESI